jgi:hypothetical protein
MPEWLITLNTVQKCHFSPNNKQTPRPGPDCIIVEIAHDEIDRALKRRFEMEALKTPPRQVADPGKDTAYRVGVIL